MAVKKVATNSKLMQGFTLIELLLALGLGGILLAGIASSMLAISKTQALAQDYLHLQDDLTFINTNLGIAAQEAIGLDDTTTTNKLVLELNSRSLSCLFENPATAFTQSYFVKNGNLVCELGKESEVLAYGVNKIDFECALTDSDKKVKYEACSNIDEDDLKEVISVKATYTLDSSKFTELKNNITYTRVITF